jgi:hypothetical protein
MVVFPKKRWARMDADQSKAHEPFGRRIHASCRMPDAEGEGDALPVHFRVDPRPVFQ